jgi:hypothetical protein
VAGLQPYTEHEDPEGGFTEQQLFLDTPAGRLFATVTQPRGRQRDIGFLSCHSFAWEQFELYPLELAFARMAAGRGFPTLVLQSRGYNDAGGDFADVTLETHVRDALAAGRFLLERTGAGRLVPVGVLFGTAVATMAGAALSAPGLALWEPSLRPGRYLDGLLRAFSVSTIMDEEGQLEENSGRRSMAESRAALDAGEQVDLFGYPLTPACYGEAHETDPLEALGSVPVRALVVSINPSKRGEAERASEALADRGIDVRREEAEGPGRGDFGLGVPRGGHLASHLAMFQDVARRTIVWAEEAW